MKTSLKIILLAAALSVMTACSAQRRAERHIRKAVALCPELAQVKARPIDTVLTAPGYADCTTVPLMEVLQGKTVYAPTGHGTAVVKLRPDSTLKVGFVAAPMPIRYKDTINYAQVVVPVNMEKAAGGSTWTWIGCILFGIVIGFVALIWIALKAKIHE